MVFLGAVAFKSAAAPANSAAWLVSAVSFRGGMILQSSVCQWDSSTSHSLSVSMSQGFACEASLPASHTSGIAAFDRYD